MASVPEQWTVWLTEERTSARNSEFVEVFDEAVEGQPYLVLQVMDGIFHEPHAFVVPCSMEKFTIGRSCRLQQLPDAMEALHILVGRTARVRIISTTTGTAKKATTSKWYAGITANLSFDPGRWRWGQKGSLFDYTAKKGRELLRPVQELSRTISTKWCGLLLSS